MKWKTLLKDIKEKVGLTLSPSSGSSATSLPSSEHLSKFENNESPATLRNLSSSPARGIHEVELDFKRHWEEFRTSSSEKEKEATLNLTVDAFCKLSKQHANVAQLVSMLVETHIFSFVVGRAFVADVEKIKISCKSKSLHLEDFLRFFLDVTKGGICPGFNLLTALEILASGHVDKQSLVDSGVFCCLIQILDTLSNPKANHVQDVNSSGVTLLPEKVDDAGQVRRLEVEGSVVHTMKALACHPSAAQSLIEDNSLELMFEMVANGSSSIFSQCKEDVALLHRIQLHRHAMQILGILLVNDNGSTARYIRKHHLIKVLLAAVKDFNPCYGDAGYIMGIVDLLLVCVELSYKPGAGGVILREDIHNAHGYQFLVRFALVLSSLPQNAGPGSASPDVPCDHVSAPGSFREQLAGSGDPFSRHFPPALYRLLDLIVDLAKTGPAALIESGSKASKVSQAKSGGHGRRKASSYDRVAEERWGESNKVKDLEAVQMLQDIFLKAESSELQSEVLDRIFRIFSSHIENYKLCLQLRTVPLLILNMDGFPLALQDRILKILEYAVTVVNCMPEQELLSLCCLLQQQQITVELKHSILSFFVKLLSFDQQYKKVLREVGMLDVLLHDLKRHKFLLGPGGLGLGSEPVDDLSGLSRFKKNLDGEDVILSSPKLLELGCGNFPIFETEETILVAWDCLSSLIKKAEVSQASFRSANGVAAILPFIVCDIHRAGVLRLISCLITEDVMQIHSEELTALVDILKSRIVTSDSGQQYEVPVDALCDTMGALWRIFGINSSAQRIFVEASGFSLLLSMLHGFQSGGMLADEPPLAVRTKIFTYLMRLATAAASNNAANRESLHSIVSSRSFYDAFSNSGVLCSECEKQVVQLFFELALETLAPPFFSDRSLTADGFDHNALGSFSTDRQRIYNACAIRTLICSLSRFTLKAQLDLLNLVDCLARAGSFNQENLTSVGCVQLLLETIHPLLHSSSPVLSAALKIIEVLGAFRMSASELQLLIRYILQTKSKNSGFILVDMAKRLILAEDMGLQSVCMAPYVEMDMSRSGHASVQVALGDRSWPPAAGYSFACWFQFNNFFKSQPAEIEQQIKKGGSSSNNKHGESRVLRIFCVCSSTSESSVFSELSLRDDGMLTLATSSSCALSFSGMEFEDGMWHHVAVVHSKPSALAGLFQASFAYIYLDGKLRHTGKLGYSPSPFGSPLKVIIGTSLGNARVGHMAWRFRSCYLYEEMLTPGCVFFMYVLGRQYRGLFQDTDLLQFVPSQACGGASMATMDALDTSLPLRNAAKLESTSSRQWDFKAEGSEIVWDLERLGNLSFQLLGKKLILALDATCTEPSRAPETCSLINLVDPTSAAASSMGGIPRLGILLGDAHIFRQRMIGDIILAAGGIAVVLALMESAETKNMLHMALTLLACVLHHNPRTLREMKTCRGYHLLALFLHRRMPLFDMQSLEIFFQIAACEASFCEAKKPDCLRSVSSPPPPPLPPPIQEPSIEDPSFPKPCDAPLSVGSHGVVEDSDGQKDSFSHISELDNVNTDIPVEASNCIVLSNPDMVEHVLLDWTLWVTAPVGIQIALLGFLENLVSMHRYRYHNLTVLRRINLVQHLMVTLQRGDVEVPVLEKLVVLLGVILEDGFLSSELESVVRFSIMTFDPPGLRKKREIVREPMGKHVIVRNMLLEMLVDLQVTIRSEELLEQWHKIVSSKLVTYFLDEGLHPTSMRWIMTLLGVCLSASPTFALRFRSSRGYHGLTRVLSSFYDSPDIYYILFSLVFEKPVYPRLPEVCMLDFHAIIPSDDRHVELKFVELLDSAISMAKSAFDTLSVRLTLAVQTGNLSQISASLVAELGERNADTAVDLQGDALMHKTYAARLMGGKTVAPAAATAVLRFMVDLAKLCPPFSAVCRRPEFLESCIDLYFSCIRAANAVNLVEDLSEKAEEKNLNECDDTNSSQNTFASLPADPDQSAKSSPSDVVLLRDHPSSSSEDVSVLRSNVATDKEDAGAPTLPGEPKKSVLPVQSDQLFGRDGVEHVSGSEHSCNAGGAVNSVKPSLSQSCASLPAVPESPILSETANSRILPAPDLAPAVAVTSWLGGASLSESKSSLQPTPSLESVSVSESDMAADVRTSSQRSYVASNFHTVTAKMLLEVNDFGFGGGPCSAGATAVLDFIAEVLSGFVTEQMKATPIMEGILEFVPSYFDADSMFIFQGLCLGRLMNFVERRLLRDDEENVRRLEKAKWSLNLDALCWMIVDRVYMGAFPQPSDVLRTLEFLLSMLQLENKDGRIEEAAPAGKGILSITRGIRHLDAYAHSLLKNTNRMVLYCFTPAFLASIGEEELLSSLGLPAEDRKRSSSNCFRDESSGTDIHTILQLLVANRHILFCPSNVDADINCCLCANLIFLLYDQRPHVRSAATDVVKHLLVHRRAAFEDLLIISKPNQGPRIDVFHGGFDQLLTGGAAFFDWLRNSKQLVSTVVEQCASVTWLQYVSGSMKLPGVRTKGMEGRRSREMGRRSRDSNKLDMRHLEQVSERRYALELLRDAMSTELRVVRQDKYGWVLHAESEWQTLIQQLVHERGIFPACKPCGNGEPEWQLCHIEGPYRMRKKLERCNLRIVSVRNVLDGQYDAEPSSSWQRDRCDAGVVSPSTNMLLFDFPLGGDKFSTKCCEIRDDILIESDGTKGDDGSCSMNEISLHSAQEFGVHSSTVSAPVSENLHENADYESQRQSSFVKLANSNATEENSDRELNDNGEYLIRPYLEPSEKIRFKYNCERIVGLDKRDGIFLIGESCLYVIESFFIDESECICEKECEGELSVIDQALGVKKDAALDMELHSRSTSSSRAAFRSCIGGRAWAYNGGAWGKEKVHSSGNLHHAWNMWKLHTIHEVLKRDYQLRPVAIEIFSIDGCNDLLVFHKKEREEVFKNLSTINLPRNTMYLLDATFLGSAKQESNEGSRLFKLMAKSFSKRWQSGEISNFQYLMHLNTLAGRGYSDLTQYPVFPWVLADYESENLDLSSVATFRKLDKPMGCQTLEGEEEFKKRYESWDDPEVPKFHYGSHYSSAGIVLFYLLRLPPFCTENQKLQGGQFDHADRLFSSVKDTWLSAAGKGNTSDVKELIPEFFYFPEFLENRFDLDLGEKQSGEKVGHVILPPWAKGSTKEFIRKHREALECDFVSENLNHWIDLIFGYKQRGKAAEEAVNVFYHYTYEGSVDIDSVKDPALKASILAQINHFGQTPKQLFVKPHVKRRTDRRMTPHPLKNSSRLVPHEVRKCSSAVGQILTFHDKILVGKANCLLKPRTYSKYIMWGFPDRSLRFVSYDQDRLLSTHENLHAGNQITCAGVSHDGRTVVTGADDGLLCVWQIGKVGPRALRSMNMEKALYGHKGKITCLHVCQPYTLIVSGSDDRSVIIWDLSSLLFVRQLSEFPSPISAIYVNDLTGEIMTAAGILLAIWSINGDCLAAVNTSQLPTDFILSVTSSRSSDWLDTNWYVTGHQSGAVRVWQMVHSASQESALGKPTANLTCELSLGNKVPEYRFVLHRVMKLHKHPVSALHVTCDLKQLLSGDSDGRLLSWTIPEVSTRASFNRG